MLVFLSLFVTAAMAYSPNDWRDFNNIYHPHFSAPVSAMNSDTDPAGDNEPDWSRDLLSQFAEVRIKVFPHNSKYNSPQGRDTIVDRVNVASAGQCTLYAADNPTSEGGITKTRIIKTGNSFDFTTSNVAAPMWLECNQPFQINRFDYPRNPLRYNGVLFIKEVNTAITPPYITLVNVLPFEEYLRGVVPSEMPASWHGEALKAQSIAARTYALYELSSKVHLSDVNIVAEGSGAQMDDTVTYQAYLGLKNTTAATDKAISDTTGKVLVHSGKVVKAYFHADSGGFTENAENVWGIYHPYIIAKKEIYPDGSIPGTQWSINTNFQDMKDKLAAVKLIDAGEVIEDIRIDKGEYFESGRPKSVTLVFADGNIQKLAAVDFSWAMKIKSAWFSLATTKTNFESNSAVSGVAINGRGFGHGAGMNQWGARVLADKMGKTSDEILKFYYTGVSITD